MSMMTALVGMKKPAEEKSAKKVTKVDLGKAGSFQIHKGALHRALGVPEGEKIPASKMASKESDSPRVKRMKASAAGLKALHHGE